MIGAGTDFGPETILPRIDVLTFDTKLPPFLYAAAKTSYKAQDSDAPANFVDMAKVARKNISWYLQHEFFRRIWHPPYTYQESHGRYHSRFYDYTGDDIDRISGAFLVFDGKVHWGADVIKVDPLARTKDDEEEMFFSPAQRARVDYRDLPKSGVPVKSIYHGDSPAENWTKICSLPSENHITRKLSMFELYDAMNNVDVVDLGDQNPVWNQVQTILDPGKKAIIVETHGLGNANNLIKSACSEAARQGKTIMIISRTLFGEVIPTDVQALTDVNNKELQGTNKRVITGHRLNKATARAFLERALLEGLDQKKTQGLVDFYCYSRGLFSQGYDPIFPYQRPRRGFV